MLEIRQEVAEDFGAVGRILEAAFDGPGEARLVAALRDVAKPCISLVAVDEGEVVGHILFTPVTVEGAPASPPPLGLGPMAVAPERQRQGIGSALVRAGLEVAALHGAPFVVVVGHPTYYPRFGFEAAAGRGLSYGPSVPAEAFLVRELEAGALEGVEGRVEYHPRFSELEGG